MKVYILPIFLFLNFFYILDCRGQLVIDDVNNWRSRVDSALTLIQQVDPPKYNTIVKTCRHIGYINDNKSTIEGSNTILLTNVDMTKGSINDIAAAIVHESDHLYYLNTGSVISTNTEEMYAYMYELSFLEKIPNVEDYLLQHCLRMIALLSDD